MKAKHIITTTCGIILGGIFVAQNAGATVTYQGSSDLQFTWGAGSLDVSLSSNSFVISDLAPGTSKNSNEVVATVTTNNATGYTLSATVGNSSNNSTELRRNGTDTANKFLMTSDNASSLTSGTWGCRYKVDSSNYGNYRALSTSGGVVVNKTVDNIGTAATGYAGTSNTTLQVGANAASNQSSGEYTNAMNFQVVVNP